MDEENTIYGEGYVYMGPLTPQHYEIPSKCIEKIKPEVQNSNNDYQFKVMLLGDSGVGKLYFYSNLFF